MLTHLKNRLRSFWSDREGTVAVEAVIIFPIVIWSLLALFVFFDAYRTTSVNHKAANTIADMLSRETDAITDVYVDNTKELFDVLSGNPSDARVRLSVIKWSKKRRKYLVVWSKVRGPGLYELKHADVEDWLDKLPSVPDQEQIVLVETWNTYNPPFRVGLDPTDMQTFVFTRLRFSPQLPFCNGGCV